MATEKKKIQNIIEKTRGIVEKIQNVPRPRPLKVPNISKPMSKGQQMLSEMFSGREEPLWGTGNNLPILHRTLTSGGGLIKHGDNRRQTGGMFGLK